MSDIALQRRSDGNFDLDFDEKSKDLLVSDGLENAIAISIGTFSRSKKLNGAANVKPSNGGWWGDSLDKNGALGGHIHECVGMLGERLCRDVESAAKDALNWMLADGVASDVSCSAEVVNEKFLDLSVVISKPSGNFEKFKYEKAWKSTYGI